jgi:TrmH family RNA methyltransferase
VARQRPVETFTERTPRVVSAVKLHRGAARRSAGRFLAEGAQAVREALADGGVHELFCTTDALARHADLVSAAEHGGIAVSIVTDRAATALSDTVTPQGIVAVCELVDVPLEQALQGAPQLVAMLVDAGEPGNAGSIIRVADAAGADAVVLAGDSVDVHNGKCVRASTGSVFHLPVARHRDAFGAVQHARAGGLQVLAAAADGELDLDDVDELLRAPTAWLFGNEAHGLAPSAAAAADHRVRIPIHGRAESLNLATAAALCLYASARAQRRAAR